MTQTPAEIWAAAKVEALWRKALLDLSQQALAQSAQFLALSRFVR